MALSAFWLVFHKPCFYCAVLSATGDKISSQACILAPLHCHLLSCLHYWLTDWMKSCFGLYYWELLNWGKQKGCLCNSCTDNNSTFHFREEYMTVREWKKKRIFLNLSKNRDLLVKPSVLKRKVLTENQMFSWINCETPSSIICTEVNSTVPLTWHFSLLLWHSVLEAIFSFSWFNHD